MRKLYVEDLQPGMVLGKTVYNERGDVLLAKGITLTPRYITALRSQGFYAVFVMNGIADDVEPPDLLSTRVRMATYKHVRELCALARRAIPAPGRESGSTTAAILASSVVPNLAQLYRDVERIIDEAMTAQTLSGIATLKSHDSYSFEHSVEVAVVGVMLGLRLRLDREELRQLALGCLCHDMGKLVVPPEILNKPGAFTPEEFDLVRRHPLAGYEIVRQMTGEGEILARHLVWQHHERQDGTGYPRGLRGINEFGYARQEYFGQGLILPAAEIAAVAEVYSALASDMPYRRAIRPAEIVRSLRLMAGSHLNREIVKRFLSMLPAYPVGTEVVVINGRLDGYRGVVTAVNAACVHRPVVRILFDSQGERVDEFEVDTAEERDIDIAVHSYADWGTRRSAHPEQAFGVAGAPTTAEA